MLISFNWLKTLIDIHESPQEIADSLTFSGLEVENIEEVESVKGGLKGLVIGEVLSCEKHPDADKLKITTIDIGENEPKPIVCGAPNVEVGQKVVVATVNSTLYPTNGEPFKIKKSKIRGQISEGMICAEDEIGLGTSHKGIMVLETQLPNGTPAADFFELSSDFIFEIGLTPNRADAASHYGVARDLKALLNRELNLPSIIEFKEGTENFDVTIENTLACPRYSGIVIKDVNIAPSPEWLQKRLRAIGINPTNNVVDATNYILHELGQPLHAFDLAEVGDKIIVKNGLNDKFKTLDDKERTLNLDDLMICNSKKPLCIAGVLGGATSGVQSTTTNIFLESAYFSADSIRKTAMKHGIKTDASFRYERGTDPNITVFALKRAALLITSIAGGYVSSKLIDIYKEPIKNFNFEVNINYLNTIIGKKIPYNTLEKILNSLEIKTNLKDDILIVSVPPYRVDVTRPADIAEEILRIYGYNNIELTHLSTQFFANSIHPEKHHIKETVSELLNGLGYHEIITNSLTNSAYYDDKKNLVNILNFNSEELNVMRKTLIYNGLEILTRNINRKQNNLKLYEFGKTYHYTENKYIEKEKLVFFCSGNQHDESWVQPAKKSTLIDLQSVVISTLHRAGLNNIKFIKNTSIYSSASASIQYNSKEIGIIGLIKQAELNKFNINQEVWYAELDWQHVAKKYKNKVIFNPLSKFPEVRRDLSLVIEKSVTFNEIEAIARKYERNILQQINIFDVYEGDKLEPNKKSYAVSFILQDDNKTLNDKAIDSVMNKLISAYEKELGAIIRR